MTQPFRNINVLLTANNTQLKQALTQSAAAVNVFDRSVGSAARSTALTSKLMAGGLAAGALAAGAGLLYATGKAVAFDKAMRNVNSLSKLSEKGLADLGAQVINLSKKLPQTATELAEGLYDITSSGFSGAEGLKVLEASATAASAGLTTTATSAKAITAVLNAYGLGAESAADVSDSLFKTVELGVVNFEELAGSIGDVVGIAAPLGIEIDELGAAIATMTTQGISGSESTTLLTNLFTKMIRPSKALTSQLAEMGYESGEAMLQANGLKGSLDLMREATGGNITSLMELFPDIQAARGALALMANEGENYATASAAIEDAEKRRGATTAALNEQMKSVAAQVKLAKNQLDALATTTGMAVLPAILKLIDAGGDLGSKMKTGLGTVIEALGPTWENLAEIFSDVWDILVDLGRAIGPVAGAFAKLAVGGVVVTLNALTEVLSLLTGAFAENEELARIFAIALGVHLLGGVAVVTKAINTGFAVALFNLRVGAALGTASIGALTTAMKAFLLTPAGAILALAGLALGAGALASALADAPPKLSAMTTAVADFARTGEVSGALVKAFGADLEDLGKTIDTANNNKWTSAFGSSEGMRDVESARNQLKGLDETLVSLVQSGHAELAEQMFGRIRTAAGDIPEEELRSAFSGYTESLAQANAETAVTAAESSKAAGAISKVGEVAGAGFASIEAYAAALDLDKEAAKLLSDEMTKLRDTLGSFVDPLGTYTTMLEAKKTKEQETAQATADSTKNSKDSWQDYVRDVKVTFADYITELEKQVTAQKQWGANLTILAARVSAETLAELRNMGPEGAALVADLVTKSDAELAKLEGVMGEKAALGADAMATQLKLGAIVIGAIAAKLGTDVAVNVAREINAGRMTVQQAAAKYGVDIYGGIAPAVVRSNASIETLRRKMEGLDGLVAKPTVKLMGLEQFGADTRTAAGALARLATLKLTGTVKDATGDGPGAPPGGGKGGKALARVSSIMEGLPGLRITSMYRSPAQNAAAGGSPTSYHLDRNDPAVDIGGPVSSLDRLAARARGKGGWRELLWRVAGHYDHVHFAATGGAINGPGSGTSDSIPAWLSNGEHVWTAKEVKGAGGHQAVEHLRSKFRFASGGGVELPKFALGGAVSASNPVSLTTAARGMTDVGQIRALVSQWEAYNVQLAEAEKRLYLVRDAAAAGRQLAGARGVTARAQAQERLNAANKALQQFDFAAARDRESAAVDRMVTKLGEEADAREKAAAAAQAAAEAAKAEAATQRDIQDNQFELGIIGQEAYMQILSQRLSAERGFSNEWMGIYQKMQSILQKQVDTARQLVATRQATVSDRTADEAAALSKLNQLLDEKASIEKRAAESRLSYGKAVQAIQDRIAEAEAAHYKRSLELRRDYEDRVRRIDQEGKAILDARRKELFDWADLAQVVDRKWANSAAQLIDNARNQAEQFSGWMAALARARARGISEEVIGALGLDKGPQALDQLQKLNTATEQEIAQLNAVVLERTRLASAQVAREQARGLGDMGVALKEAAAQYAAAQAEMLLQYRDAQNQFQTDLRVLQADFAAQQLGFATELANLGMTQGRSYSQAVEAGILSGLPGILNAVSAVQSATGALAQAQAALSAAQAAADQAALAAAAAAAEAAARASAQAAAAPPPSYSYSAPAASSWSSPATPTAGAGYPGAPPRGTPGSFMLNGVLVHVNAAGIIDTRGAMYGKYPMQVASGTFDSGGWLQPGFTLAYNGTGKAERVTTAEQSAASGGGITINVNAPVFGVDQLERVITGAVETTMTRRGTVAQIAGGR